MAGPWEEFQKKESGPWEEFAPVKQAPATAPQVATESPGFLSNMARVLTSPRLAGGPMAMIGREGVKQIDEGIERGAVGGGGAATDVLGSMGLPPEVAAGGGVLANMGVRAIPSVLGYGAGNVAELGTKPLGRFVMQSALKPSSKDIASGTAGKVIDTMLQKGYNVTPGSVSAMRTQVKALSEQVDDLIKATNTTVDERIILQELQEKLGEFKLQARPMADVKTINKAWKEFTRSWDTKNMPVQLAQKIKQGTYKVLADKYAHLGTVGDEAATQADMAIARGLRKGIEQQVPGVKAPNKEMQELINAIEIAERRAGVAGNRDLAGIAWLAENPAAAGGMLADRSPWLKSLLARYLFSGMPATGALAGTVAGQYPALSGGPQP